MKPSSPRRDRVAHPAVAGVEAALEADVHGHAARRLELGECDGPLEVERHGLLAEGGDVARDGCLEQPACAAVPAVMTNASRPESSRASMLGAALTPRSVATRCGDRRVEVGEHEVVHARERGQGLGVEGTDPSGAGEADAHVQSFEGVGWVCSWGQGALSRGIHGEVRPALAHPGVCRVVADQPGALGARPGHDVEVVQVSVRGRDGGTVPAVRHEHHVAGAHLSDHVDRPVRGAVHPLVPDSIGASLVGRLRLEPVDLLELGFDAGAVGVVLVRRPRAPVAGRRDDLAGDDPVCVEHAGHTEVAHLTRSDSGTSQLDGNLCGGQVPRRDADASTRVRQAHRDPHGIPLGQVGAWAHPQGRAGWGVDDVRRAGEDAGPPMEREGLIRLPVG